MTKMSDLPYQELLMTQKARTLLGREKSATRTASEAPAREDIRSALRDLEQEILGNAALVSKGAAFAQRLRSRTRQLVQEFLKGETS